MTIGKPYQAGALYASDPLTSYFSNVTFGEGLPLLLQQPPSVHTRETYREAVHASDYFAVVQRFAACASGCNFSIQAWFLMAPSFLMVVLTGSAHAKHESLSTGSNVMAQ